MSKQKVSSEPLIEVTKQASCRSLSNTSDIGYELGQDNEGQVFIRLTSNSSPGQLHPGWVAIAAIQSALKACPIDRPLTSSLLAPLYRGRSRNNSGFALAAIRNEGLVPAEAQEVKRKRSKETA